MESASSLRSECGYCDVPIDTRTYIVDHAANRADVLVNFGLMEVTQAKSMQGRKFGLRVSCAALVGDLHQEGLW